MKINETELYTIRAYLQFRRSLPFYYTVETALKSRPLCLKTVKEMVKLHPDHVTIPFQTYITTELESMCKVLPEALTYDQYLHALEACRQDVVDHIVIHQLQEN